MGMTWGDLGNKALGAVTPWDTGYEKEQKAEAAAAQQARRAELTNVYDPYTLQQLQQLDDIASGREMTLAEREARDLAGKMGAGVMGVSKLRRGVSGAGTFAQAAQQAHDIRTTGMQQADAIKRKQKVQAGAQALQLRAGKEAEKRSLEMTYEGQLQAAQQADEAAQAGLFGAFMQTAGTIVSVMMLA